MIATGDGVAMAFRAGARVADLEFVQFHPTVLNVPGAPRFLLSEALRGEGARLVNKHGESFMERYEPAGDLASRDLVSRAMVREAERTASSVYLTLAHLPAAFIRERFPTIAEACAAVGLDLAIDPIPVSPAAHYVMGGVQTDLGGRTSLAGLYAAGEVACTGVHGANRLASNSLLEGLVFGARAALAMRAGAGAAVLPESDVLDDCLERDSGDAVVPSVGEVRDLMWRHVGVLRTRAGLEQAVARLRAWAWAITRLTGGTHDPDARRLENLATVGGLIAQAALRRTESRGAHFRTDFPLRDDLHWKKRVAQRRHDH
jgi:L-aspartate oxidase